MQLNTETEQKIIDAAQSVFREKGLDGARMQEIADRAGINKALLHYYFRSKDRLFQTVFRTEVQGVFQRMIEAVTATENIREFLRTFINTYLDNISERSYLIRFVMWESENKSDEFETIFKQVMSTKGFTKNPLVQRIEQAVADGQIRAVNPYHFVLSLIGMCVLPYVAPTAVRNIIGIRDTSSAEFLETRKKEIFNLVWQGLKSK